MVPFNILNLLTPIGLAPWIQQDGSFHKISKGVTICTDSFTKKEVELICFVLTEKFNLSGTIQRAPNKSLDRFRIYISAKSVSTLT